MKSTNHSELTPRAALGVAAEMALEPELTTGRRPAESKDESTVWRRYLGFLAGEGLSDRDQREALDFDDREGRLGSRRMHGLAVATLLGAAALLALWVWLVASSDRPDVPSFDRNAGSAAEIVIEEPESADYRLT